MTVDAISFLSFICVFLMLVEYASQIHKIHKRKTAEDLSWIYWGTKITITILQFVILIVSHNPLKVYISQFISLIGCLVIFTMMYYYHNKHY